MTFYDLLYAGLLLYAVWPGPSIRTFTVNIDGVES